MPTQDCYEEVRSMIIERCQDESKPISVPTRLPGAARKALQSSLRIVGEKSSVIDKVFGDLWREQLLLIDDQRHLVFNKELDDARREECLKNHPVGAKLLAATT